jgi:uncharacterized Rossmann fold enzyme
MSAVLKPLEISVQQAGTAESNSDNIRSAMARKLPELAPAICPNDGTFVIVGSGPSVVDHLEEIRKDSEIGRPICAIKGTHDWLIQNGIDPNLFLSVEPRVRPLKHQSQNTVYLLASRCPPELFDQLKDHKVMLWHSWSMEPECKLWKGHFGIGGGTTSGLRAINVGYILGFRKFLLYGMDSCLAADKDTKRFTGEIVGDGLVVDVHVGDRIFYCNGALAQQANEFQLLYQGMPDATIEAKGDGLIAAILSERRRLGRHA